MTGTEHPAAVPPHLPNGPSPDQIMAVAGGYINARMLFTACDIELFAALDAAGATAAELAQRCGVPERSVRIVADVLATCGILELNGGRYRNAPPAEAFLSGRGPLDLGSLLRYWDIVSYQRAAAATMAVRTSQGVPCALDAGQVEAFQQWVAFATAQGAETLAAAYDFTDHRRVLDVGGGLGTMVLPLLIRFPHLTATLIDLPEVVGLARKRLAASPAAGRIDPVAADAFTDPLPAGHDCILVAHFMHLLPPERNVALLKRLRAVAAPDTVLLLVDWWRHWDGIPPAEAVYGAVEFLLISGGDTYTPEEAGQWLGATGWQATGWQPLAEPTSLLIARPRGSG